MNRYIHGSEAYEIPQEMPVRIPRRREGLTEEEIRRRRAKYYAAENRRKAGRFGILYTGIIAFAVGFALLVSVKYVSLFNEKNENSKEISSLRSELTDLKESNDNKQLEIDTSINYDYIYKVATEELGMVHAGSGQVLEYTSGEYEYVIQYKDEFSGK